MKCLIMKYLLTDRYGISISNSFENLIYNNTIKNVYIGIYLIDLLPSFGYVNTTNNLFYQNDLRGTTKSVYIDQYEGIKPGFNFWDNGKEGNYYSNYNGTDADRDGIGDTPYVIDSNNQDRYPLVAFVDVNNNTTELPKIEPSFTFFSTTLIFFSSILLTAVGLGL